MGGHQWVTEFQQALKTRLQMRWGQTPEIWWDQQELRGSHYVEDEIVDRLAEVGLFLAMMSPSFLTSDWRVPKELKGFYQAAEQNVGVRIGNKSRLFNVVKTEVPEARVPTELQPLRRFEFFERDIKGQVREFLPVREDIKFWNTLDDLVTELVAFLNELAALPPRERVLETSQQALHSSPGPPILGGSEGQSPPVLGDLGGECRTSEPFQTSP